MRQQILRKTILSDSHILFCPSFLKLSSLRKLFKIKERKFTHCKWLKLKKPFVNLSLGSDL